MGPDPFAAPDQQPVELALDEFMAPLAPGIRRAESLGEERGDSRLKTGIMGPIGAGIYRAAA